MTRLQTLENRLENLREVREDYIKGIKIGGIIKANPKSGKYMRLLMKIQKEIKNLQN